MKILDTKKKSNFRSILWNSLLWISIICITEVLEIQLILKPKENQYLQKSKEIQLLLKFTEIQNHPLRARLQTSWVSLSQRVVWARTHWMSRQRLPRTQRSKSSPSISSPCSGEWGWVVAEGTQGREPCLWRTDWMSGTDSLTEVVPPCSSGPG